MSTEFGLAISDDKDSIAIFTDQRIMHVFQKEKIHSCELNINNKTIVNTKSKIPVVTWNTLENTKGTMTNQFESAVLKITVDDIETPFFKLKFSDLGIAEKYDALIRLVSSNKTN